jgi:anti-sigma factor RsiW
LLSCKQFLQELSDYLDDTVDPKLKAELQRHVNECPNCWVVCDTTEKTIRVFKGLEPKAIPEHVHTKLMQALEKKMRERGCDPFGGNAEV